MGVEKKELTRSAEGKPRNAPKDSGPPTGTVPANLDIALESPVKALWRGMAVWPTAVRAGARMPCWRMARTLTSAHGYRALDASYSGGPGRICFQRLQVVRPLLHHLAAFGEKCSAIVGAPIRVFHGMSELMFDKIHTDAQHFI